MEWAHTNRFGEAKQEDWLNALIFYGVRQPASRAVWTYFEQCEEQWRRRPPASFPSFEQWWRFAQRARLRGSPTSAVVSQEVENFVEWKDFSLWLQPLFLGAIGLPPHALSEIESRCAGLADLSEANAMRRATTRSSLWRRITRVCEDRAVLRAKREGWVGILLEQVESHPLHVRTQAYAAHWKEEWNRDQLSRYPSLAEWKQAAAEYVNSDRP